jgi:hypothetical protein
MARQIQERNVQASGDLLSFTRTLDTPPPYFSVHQHDRLFYSALAEPLFQEIEIRPPFNFSHVNAIPSAASGRVPESLIGQLQTPPPSFFRHINTIG